MTMLPLQRRILVATARGYWTWILLFGLVTLAGSLATMAGPIVFSGALARIAEASLAATTAALAAFAGCIAFGRITQDLRLTLVNRFEQRLRNRAAKMLLDGMMKLDPACFIENNPGKIGALMQSLHAANKTCLQVGLMAVLGGGVDFAVSFALVGFFVDWTVSAFVLVYGLCIVLITLRSNKATSTALQAAQGRANEGANLLGNIVSNITAIRLFRAEPWLSGLYDKTYRDAAGAWNRFYGTRLRYSLVQAGLLFLQYASVFVMLLLTAGSANAAPAIVAVSMILLQLNRPFELMGTSLRDLAVARGMAQPMQALFERYGKAPGALPPATAALPAAPGVDIERLSFGYDGGRPLLSDVTQSFAPGMLNFIVGPSGAGKSTLMAILLKINEGYQGRVSVGGRNLREMPADAYFDRIGHVPQDPPLMNMSIRDNVCFGRPFTDEAIIETLGRVRFTEKLDALPEGLGYLVGERGQRLSGGERQRLAIARALIGRPSILFLDEPSAALDAATERGIFDMLRTLAGETTIIAITHRLGVIQGGDRVLNLTPGQKENC